MQLLFFCIKYSQEFNLWQQGIRTWRAAKRSEAASAISYIVKNLELS